MINAYVAELYQDNGLLPAYGWPGGYPIIYYDNESNTLCPDCANKHGEYSGELVGYDVNWENTGLNCDNCYRHLESAYGDDNETGEN